MTAFVAEVGLFLVSMVSAAERGLHALANSARPSRDIWNAQVDRARSAHGSVRSSPDERKDERLRTVRSLLFRFSEGVAAR